MSLPGNATAVRLATYRGVTCLDQERPSPSRALHVAATERSSARGRSAPFFFVPCVHAGDRLSRDDPMTGIDIVWLYPHSRDSGALAEHAVCRSRAREWFADFQCTLLTGAAQSGIRRRKGVFRSALFTPCSIGAGITSKRVLASDGASRFCAFLLRALSPASGRNSPSA